MGGNKIKFWVEFLICSLLAVISCVSIIVGLDSPVLCALSIVGAPVGVYFALKKFDFKKKYYGYLCGLLVASLVFVGVSLGSSDTSSTSSKTNTEKVASEMSDKSKEDTKHHESEKEEKQESVQEVPKEEPKQESSIFDGYRKLEVDGGNLSGSREPNVVVDIGYGDREYWAFTNEYGQLVKVVADEIILQDDSTESVTKDGRYYKDEAKVPGVERSDLDEGHVIADSLGGVSNAYNITPQNSTLNRHGDQAYMEKVIRDAGGCTNFVAIITYPDTSTQIPSHYSYTYTLNGQQVNDEFDNINSDTASSNSGSSSSSNNAGSSSGGSNWNQVVTEDPSSGEMVWVTATGSKYHNNNCGKTDPNKTRQMSADDAKAQGLEPCKKCY